MRIGLFTDAYHPSTNGITVVVDIMKNNLETLGHEVYVVAPAASLRWWLFKERHVIRFPGLKGLFFDEFLTSVFFPPKQARRIKRLNLDAIIIFTPAQVGLMGAYCALTQGIPLYSQYSTDLTEYIERYPAVMPGVIALYTAVPFALKSKPRDVLRVTRELVSKQDDMSWKSYSIQRVVTFLHNRCTAVVSVSPKVTRMLQSWGTTAPVYTIPTGVNKGVVDQRVVSVLRKKYKLEGSKVLLSLGRVAKEKNIDLIINAMPIILEFEPKTKLLIVGDFSYRAKLEEKVIILGLEDAVIFTGRVSLKDRWNMFALANIFCFPSLTDTQALVVNEAALMGLPLLWCDEGVNEILVDKKSGLHCKNTPQSFAKHAVELLGSERKRLAYGEYAHKKAIEYSERNQTQQLVKMIQATKNKSVTED